MPNLLVDGIRQAVEASPALKIYVCNVATQCGETDSFTVGDHFGVLQRHLGGHLFDYVLANSNTRGKLPEKARSQPVTVDKTHLNGARVISADVVSRYHPIQETHDTWSTSTTAAPARQFVDKPQRHRLILPRP
jgi:uncharacterized cofD-like protein